MKKIEAVIRHHKLDEVRAALNAAGITGITVTEARGFGRQKGHTESYRGAEYTVDLLPKIKIEVAAADDMVTNLTQAIISASRTGEVGDGKIFISELSDCVRIRTGETGDAAI